MASALVISDDDRRENDAARDQIIDARLEQAGFIEAVKARRSFMETHRRLAVILASTPDDLAP